MRRTSLRLLSSLLALLLLTGVLAFSFEAQATNDLVYLFVNDTLLLDLTTSNMPLRIGNSMYISYRHLLRIKPLKYFYDEDIRILKVYTSGGSLVFDVGNSITYDQDGRIYSYLAEIRNGVLYVPVEFICRFFGITYHQFSSPLGPVIRINNILSPYSDNDLLTANADIMQDLYDEYYPAPEPTVPPVVVAPVTPVPEPEEQIRPRTTYPMIVGPLNEYTATLLTALDSYGAGAAFFLSGEGLQSQSDLLRRIVCSDFSLGLYVSAEDPVTEAEAINDVLSALVFRKTRLIAIREGSGALTQQQRDALSAAGYILWDGILDPGSAERTSYTVGINGQNLLKNAPVVSTLLLHSTEGTRDSIYTLLRYMRDNSFTALSIGEWTTPIIQ